MSLAHLRYQQVEPTWFAVEDVEIALKQASPIEGTSLKLVSPVIFNVLQK